MIIRDMPRQPVLELVNATVVKGGVTILHALNLTIHDGEGTLRTFGVRPADDPGAVAVDGSTK